MQEPIEFAAVAPQLAARGWRPFPGYQETKVPAMRGWSGLNWAPWECTDLVAAIDEYQPPEAFCCCVAVQPEIVAIDLDITNPEHATAAAALADEFLGVTPLVRIGLAPKCVRIYRNGDGVRSRKLHPLEIFAWLAPKSRTPILLAECLAAELKRRQQSDSCRDAGPVGSLHQQIVQARATPAPTYGTPPRRQGEWAGDH